MERLMGTTPEGYAIMAVQCTVSSLAGVVNEVLMKRRPWESIHKQNTKLYIWSFLITIVFVLVTYQQTIIEHNQAATIGEDIGDMGDMAPLGAQLEEVKLPGNHVGSSASMRLESSGIVKITRGVLTHVIEGMNNNKRNRDGSGPYSPRDATPPFTSPSPTADATPYESFSSYLGNSLTILFSAPIYLTILINQAAMGLVISWVFKYCQLGNIAKLYANAGSSLLLACWSIFSSDYYLSASFVLGAAMMLGSLVLYARASEHTPPSHGAMGSALGGDAEKGLV